MAQRLDLDRLDTDLAGAGVRLGIGGLYGVSIGYSRLGGRSDGIVLEEFDVESTFTLVANTALAFGVVTDAGVATIDSDRFANSNTLARYGFGIELSSTPYRALQLVASLRYRIYIDNTSQATCRDGAASGQLGRGACAYHGGVRLYNEYVGDGSGPEAAVSLRYRF